MAVAVVLTLSLGPPERDAPVGSVGAPRCRAQSPADDQASPALPMGAAAAAGTLAYTAIPMEVVDRERAARDFISVDSEGAVIARGETPQTVVFVEPATGTEDRIQVELQSGGPKLSGDGARFFYSGSFGNSNLGLNVFDRGRRTFAQFSSTGSFFFTVDAPGKRIAFQSDYPPRGQYMLFDEASGDTVQITDDPQAIVWPNSLADCPYASGATPMINGWGTRIAIATRSTLGLVPADPNVGCHIVTYEIAERRLRYVTGLSKDLTLSRPAISDDGRWLSFTTSRPRAGGLRRYTAALLDLDSGALVESVIGLLRDEDQAFESIITSDGQHVLLASNGNLDPGVGNADANFDLFILDRASDTIQQVTDTTGAIGPGSGACGFPSLDVNRDGTVIVIVYPTDEDSPCHYNGPPRHRSTGLYYRTTRLVRKRPGNHAAVWSPPSHLEVAAGATLVYDLTATDPDGDRLTFFAQEMGNVTLPAGVAIEDHGDGTATLRWPTRVEQAGSYVVRLAVFDEGGGERVQDVTLAVRPRQASACAADCNGDGQVVVAELVLGVRVLLEQAPLGECAAADVDGDGRVTVEELIRAIGDALGGCAPAAQG